MLDTESRSHVLTASNIEKTYEIRGGGLFRSRPSLRAVRGVDLTLEKGRTLGLVGESGCGKSTLAKCIMGIETPSGGHITLHGEKVDFTDLDARRRYWERVQYVFQDPYATLNPRMGIGETVGEPLQLRRGLSGDALRKRIYELLGMVGLGAEYAGRFPHQLSGGQRQRVGIARALSLDPEVLILDEPISALDVSIQAQVINLLQDLQDELGLTYLFVAHDLSVVRHISDRVAVMYLGRIVEEGAKADVFEHPQHPYTKALMDAVPLPDPDAPPNVRPLAGELPDPVTPPSGCSFRTRCPKAVDFCGVERPLLLSRGRGHSQAACHFPLDEKDHA